LCVSPRPKGGLGSKMGILLRLLSALEESGRSHIGQKAGRKEARGASGAAQERVNSLEISSVTSA